MKHLFTIILLFFSLFLSAQHEVAKNVENLVSKKTNFKQVTPLTVNPGANDTDTKKVVSNATYAIFNQQAVQDVASHNYNALEVTVPYVDSTITVQLYKADIIAEGFHIDTDKQKDIPYKKGVHYRGIVKGDYTSVAAFSFFNNEISGIVSSAALNNIVIGRLQKPGNTSDYIIYSDTQLNILNDFHCTAEGGLTGVPAQQFGQKNIENTLTTRCVTVYFEIDYDLFVQNNFSTDQTAAWMTAVFNNVQTLFANDGITTAIKSIFIWTEPDPYFGEGSSDYLYQFYQMRPIFDGDVGQLVGIDDGGLGGVAIDIAGICSDYNVSYSDVNFEYQQVPLFSWTIEVITHELGHLYGSPHTHGCYWNGNNTAIDGCGTQQGYQEGNCPQGPIPSPEVQGTIMSYCHLVPGVGINFANGFGIQPAQRIINHIESSQCLSFDCVNTCINTVNAFAVTDNSMTSATITWADDNGGPWEIGYAPLNNFIANWQTVTNNSFTINNLNPETYYTFAIRPLCGEGIQAETQTIIFTGATNWCSGTLFTDTGGTFTNYGNDEHLIRTIKPESPSESFTVTFTEFSLEDDYDFMYVYDGADSSAPLIGMYSGSQIPGPFQSTAPDGALTFEFISDSFITQSGWSASVDCVLGTINNTFTQLQYYPNPASNIVHITAAEVLSKVSIYNISGQLLLERSVDSTTFDADISGFATGVYFFKVSGEGKESHFRIIKQ